MLILDRLGNILGNPWQIYRVETSLDFDPLTTRPQKIEYSYSQSMHPDSFRNASKPFLSHPTDNTRISGSHLIWHISHYSCLRLINIFLML